VHLSGHALQCDTCRHFVTSSTEPRATLYLDAARACILDVGWRRTTLTEVARRAGVSPDDDLPHLVRHAAAARRPDDPRVGGVVAVAASGPEDAAPSTHRRHRDRARRALRENELFVRIVELDPQLLLPYLLSRRGRSQQAILDLVADQLRAGRRPARSRRRPRRPRRALLLATHGFVLSAHTMVDDRPPRTRSRPSWPRS
jgi:hypothetical protein